jgi:hypothetical protein
MNELSRTDTETRQSPALEKRERLWAKSRVGGEQAVPSPRPTSLGTLGFFGCGFARRECWLRSNWRRERYWDPTLSVFRGLACLPAAGGVRREIELVPNCGDGCEDYALQHAVCPSRPVNPRGEGLPQTQQWVGGKPRRGMTQLMPDGLRRLGRPPGLATARRQPRSRARQGWGHEQVATR